MASIELPNEILKALTDFIHPLDLIAFVTTCKTNHTLAASRLKEHRELRDKYRAIGVIDRGASRATLCYKHPYDLLYDLDRSPWLACYIRAVSFQPEDGDGHTPEPDWVSGCSFTPDTSAKLDSLCTKPSEIIRTLSLSDAERVTWHTALDKGDHSASFAVLLLVLPELRSLSLQGHGEVYKPWLDPIWRYGSHDTAARPILSKFEELSVAHWDTEYGEDPRVLEELIFVPSLRKLRAHMIGDSESRDADQYISMTSKDPNDERVSKIREVDISYSGLSATALAEIVKPMVDLQWLNYEDGTGWDVCGENEVA